MDLDFATIAAPLDPRLSPNDRDVLTAIERHQPTSLDELCALMPRTPREHVFAAVARLEDYGLLTKSAIR